MSARQGRTKMAPYPEELDVFTVPHSRMKELIHKYCDMLSHTNFSSGPEFGNLLQNLHNTFSEFKSHEAIENRYIMTQLRNKLDALSIQNTAVCNCHKDNRLTEMMNMFRDGYYWMDKTMRERLNYGIQLKEALDDFTKDFVPHMKEEEEVFQPLLMKYFSYEELQNLREKVINEHTRNQNEKKYVWDEKEEVVEGDQSEKSSEKEEIQEKTSVLDLPPEIMMKIFSHLNPKDLCRCAQVSSSWSEVAMDGKLWQEVSPVRWAQGDWRFHAKDEEEEDDDDDSSEVYDEDEEAGYVCLDEDRDIDESESNDEYSESESDSVYLLKRESKMLHSLVRYILPRVGWGVEKLNLANSKTLTNALLYKMLSHCANIEHLILTQTAISDSAFKGLFKHAACTKLKTLVLSGCANITDVTLIRFANATARNIKPETMLLAKDNTTFEDADQKDEMVQSYHKEYWTFSKVENDGTGSESEDSGVVLENETEVVDGVVTKETTTHEDANCCRFGCGCRVGLSLGTRLKFDNTIGVDATEYNAVTDTGDVNIDAGILREMSQDPLVCDLGVDPSGMRKYPDVFEPFYPDAESKPPDWPVIDLEECAATFVRQKDGELRRASNCNDPRCFKSMKAVGGPEGEKWIKITMEETYVEQVARNVAGDRDKDALVFEKLDAISVHNQDEIPDKNDVDDSGNGPGARLVPGVDVVGGRPPDNCDYMRGANDKDSPRGKVVICPEDGAVCDAVNSEEAVVADAENPFVSIATNGICCKVLEELQAPQYASKHPTAPAGGHAEIQESVAALMHEPGTQPSPHDYNTGDPNRVQNDVTTAPRVLKPQTLFSHEKLKRTFEQDPLDSDLSYDFETLMATTPRHARALQHLNLSGCFRVTDVGLRSLGKYGGLPSLRFLDLSGCSNISAAGLADLVQGCPNLEYDKFYYCDNITDGPLASLANGCQNLSCARRVCCRSGLYLYN